jgi:hypothetical protein
MLRPFEHQVLEQMCKARLPRLLARGADMIPHVNGDRGNAVVFMENDVEAIGKCPADVREGEVPVSGERRPTGEYHQDEKPFH